MPSADERTVVVTTEFIPKLNNWCPCSASEPQDTDQVPEADGMPPSEKTSKGDGASMAASVFSLTNTIIGAGALGAFTLRATRCVNP